LPVPLENLFPTGDSFSDSVTTTFSEAFDGNSDETSFGVSGTDPNKIAFAWTIIVGEEEDVQSFVKRDGSHLELFECPDTHEDDFDVQKAKAVCAGQKKTTIARISLKEALRALLFAYPHTVGQMTGCVQ